MDSTQGPIGSGPIGQGPIGSGSGPLVNSVIALPDTLPSICRQTANAALVVAATGLSLILPVPNAYAANQRLGVELTSPPLLTYTQRDNAPAGLVATGVSLVPGAINNAAASQPLGFEFVTPALVTYAQRENAPAGLVAATGLSLALQPITQSYRNGWSVALPDLPQFKRAQDLTVVTGRIDQPTQTVASFPNGWTVDVPELTYAFRDNVPAGMAATGLSLVPGVISNFAANQSLGFELAPSALTTYALRDNAPAGMAATGLSLPSQTITQPLVNGWSVALPDLLQHGRKQALSELSGRIDQSAQAAVLANGWSISLPDLSSAIERIKYTPRPTHYLGAINTVAPLMVLVPIEPPPMKRVNPNFAGLAGRATFGSFDPFYPWWSVTLPDALPMRWRKPHASTPRHFLGTSTTVAPLMALVPIESPPTKRVNPNFAGLSGESIFGSFDPFYPWWSATLPDALPMRWRKPHVTTPRHFLGTINTAQNPAPLMALVPIESPPLRYRQRVVFTDQTGRLDQFAQASTGWTINAPELPQFSFKRVAQASTGISLIPGSINNAAANQPLGFELAPPALTTYGLRDNATAGMVATGLNLAPQQIKQPLVNGWSIDLPDLPAFKRKQVFPELSGRIDQPAQIVVTFLNGWEFTSPAFTTYGLRDNAPAAMVATGLNLAPGAINNAAANQPLGFEPVTQALPLRWPIRDPRMPFVEGLNLAPQTVVQTLPYGWSVALPELPQPKLRNAAQVATGLSMPSQVIRLPPITGWTVVTVDVPPRSNHCRFELPPINVWAVPPVLIPPAVFACAVNQVVVAYSAVSAIPDVADYAAAGVDAAYSVAGRFDTADYAVGNLAQVQLYGALGSDVADYRATNADAARFMVATSELACTG